MLCLADTLTNLVLLVNHADVIIFIFASYSQNQSGYIIDYIVETLKHKTRPFWS